MTSPTIARTIPCVLLLAALVAAFPGARVAEGTGHVPAPLTIEASLTDERLGTQLLVDALLYRHWTGRDPRELPLLDDEAFDAACDEFATFLLTDAPIALDGIDVRPVVTDIAFQEGFQENDFIDFVAIDAHYGTKGPPGTIEFTWTRFDTEDSFPLEAAYCVLATPDDFEVMKFTPGAPAQLWQRPDAPPMVDPEEVRPGVPEPGGHLPLVSVGLLVLVLGAAFSMRARRVPVPRIVGLITVGLVGAYSTGSIGVVNFRWPGEPAVVLPAEDEARALFVTLHRNIYRAFDYTDEGQVYDALARSLAPGMIDTVYGEVYRSLRMQLELDEEAGAEIRSVRILEAKPEIPPSPEEPAFGVVARWEVIGTVRHWGHGHWRTNVYTARYRVRWAAEDGWRIDRVEILDQRRVDDGREVAL